VDIARELAVVTIGVIKGGVRENIIPDNGEMRGTRRAFDEGMRDEIHERVTTLADAIARGSRAGCTVCISKTYPVAINDPALTDAMVPTLQRATRPERLQLIANVTGAEDFSFFQRIVPGLFLFLGVTPPGIDPAKAYSNHSPRFFADERSFVLGARALAHLTCDFLESRASTATLCSACAAVHRRAHQPASDRLVIGSGDSGQQFIFDRLDPAAALGEQVSARFGHLDLLDTPMHGVWTARYGAAALQIGHDHAHRLRRQQRQARQVRTGSTGIGRQHRQHRELRQRDLQAR
jgi:hypothetical protein